MLKHVRHTLHTNTLALHPGPAQNTYDTGYILTHPLYILALLKHVRHTHTLALHPGPAQTRTTHTTYSHTRSTSWPCSNTYDTRNTLALHPGHAQTRTTYSHTRSTSWPCSNTYDTGYILTHSLYILALLKHVRHTHTLALHPGPAQTRTTRATYSHTRSTSWPRSNTYDTHYILTHSLYILTPLKHVRHTLHTRSTSWPRSNTYDTRYILTHSLYILAPLKHVRHTLHTHTLALHPGPAQTRTTHATY